MNLCQKYPVWHFKSIRSHVLKFLYRYHMCHFEIKIEISETNSIEELLNICDKLSNMVIDDSLYTDTWYRRHRKNQLIIHKTINIFDNNDDNNNNEDENESSFFMSLGM